MGRNTTGRMCAAQSQRGIAEAAGGLEEFALVFPGSRGEVLGLMERYCNGAAGGDKTVLRQAADRIAAVDMLEILQGK